MKEAAYDVMHVLKKPEAKAYLHVLMEKEQQKGQQKEEKPT